jgi:hypothetical protein
MILIHSGWEARGEDGPSVRDNYDKGWDYVLGGYRDKGQKEVLAEYLPDQV